MHHRTHSMVDARTHAHACRRVADAQCAPSYAHTRVAQGAHPLFRARLPSSVQHTPGEERLCNVHSFISNYVQVESAWICFKHFLRNCDKGRLIQSPFSCMISTLKLACISVDQQKFCWNVPVPLFGDTNGTASGHYFGQFKWW